MEQISGTRESGLRCGYHVTGVARASSNLPKKRVRKPQTFPVKIWFSYSLLIVHHDPAFELHRKQHYNMREAMERAKRLMAEEDDEDEDENE